MPVKKGKGKVKGADPDALTGLVAEEAPKVRKRAHKIQKQLEDIETGLEHVDQFAVTGPRTSRDGPAAYNEAIGTWPAQYQPPTTKRDKVRALKLAALEEAKGGVNSKFGQIAASDADFEWMIDHDELRRTMEFDRLFVQRFNFEDPLHLKHMQELYPEFFEKRLKQIKALATIQVRLAEIYLTGMKDFSDLELINGLEMEVGEKDPKTGLPKILSVPVHMLASDPNLITVQPDDTIQSPTVSMGQYFSSGPERPGFRKGFGWKLATPALGHYNKLSGLKRPFTWGSTNRSGLDIQGRLFT